MSKKLRQVKGEVYGQDLASPVDEKEMTNQPRFTLVDTDFPEIRDWKVGEEQELEIEVEVVSISKNEYGKTPMRAVVKIVKGEMSDEGNEDPEEAQDVLMAKRGHK